MSGSRRGRACPRWLSARRLFCCLSVGRLMDRSAAECAGHGMLLGATGSTSRGRHHWAGHSGLLRRRCARRMAVSASTVTVFSAEVHPSRSGHVQSPPSCWRNCGERSLARLTAGPMGRAAASRDWTSSPALGASSSSSSWDRAYRPVLAPEPPTRARPYTRGSRGGVDRTRLSRRFTASDPLRSRRRAMLFGQLVMVMLMVITPCTCAASTCDWQHLVRHLGHVSACMRSHHLGRLADRGRLPVIITAAPF